MKKGNLALITILAATASAQSVAAVDVGAAVTAISSDGAAAISAIGGALIGLAGLAVVYKWAKGAIFG